MAQKKAADDVLLVELDAVKRLLMLFLVKAGTPQGEIAMTLGINQSSVSRMFPASKMKRFEAMK